MQKNILLGIIVFLLLVAIIPPVIAGEMDPVGSANLSVIVTPPLNGNQFYTGETVYFSGVNHISNQTYVRIINYVLSDSDPRLVYPVVNGQWSGSYTYTDSTRSGRSQLCVLPYSDEVAGTLPVYPEQAFAYFDGYPGTKPTPIPTATIVTYSATVTGTSTVKAKVTPTPTPTPNYDEKIANLESTVAKQNETITNISTAIKKTPKPTATVNYSATIAVLQKQIDSEQAKNKEQDDFISQILAFLGLK